MGRFFITQCVSLHHKTFDLCAYILLPLAEAPCTIWHWLYIKKVTPSQEVMTRFLNLQNHDCKKRAYSLKVLAGFPKKSIQISMQSYLVCTPKPTIPNS